MQQSFTGMALPAPANHPPPHPALHASKGSLYIPAFREMVKQSPRDRRCYPDHTVALGTARTWASLRSPRPTCGVDSLQKFRHLLLFRLNSKTKCQKEGLPSNQCVQYFNDFTQGEVTVIERTNHWNGWKNTAFLLTYASGNAVDTALVCLQPSPAYLPTLSHPQGQAHLLIHSTHAFASVLPTSKVCVPNSMC